MRLIPLKIAVAVGIAMSSLFLFCNLFFSLAGDNALVWVMNVLYYDMNFKPLLGTGGFNFGHIFCGIGLCFITGFLIGFIAAATYNAMSKRELMEEQFSIFKKIIEEHISFPVSKQEQEPAQDNDPQPPIGFGRK